MNDDKKLALNNAERLIPEFRFPEFKNGGEWQKKILEDVLDYERPDNYIVSDTDYQNEGTPVLTANKSFILGYTQEKFGIYSNLPAIIFDDFTVDSKYVDFPFKVKSSAIKILTPKKKDNLKFVYELISQIRFEAKEHKRYYISEYQKIELPFPLPKEQQKIASCLSSLDDVIADHTQKLELLKDHKKGLMQNLFPQEGEKVPKFRFMEFEKDGEWVETKLGAAAAFINGRAYKQEELLEKGKYRVLRVGNFFTNNNWYYSDLELEADKYCDDGDLLYAWSASFGPRVWKGEKVIYHYHIWKVLPNTSTAKDFLCVLLDNETERMKTQNANGFALLHITKGTIENWKCNIPKSKVEQNKIASCLSTLDDLITAQAEKIEQLKLHKKGLMQSLFPKIID